MEQEKLKKIVSAATVAGVLLALILAAIIIYQLIFLSVQKKKRAQLAVEIEYYKQIIATTTNELERASSKFYLEQRARELGLIYQTDKPYKG